MLGGSAFFGCGHPIGERDGQGVERWLPAYGPLRLTGTLRVQRPAPDRNDGQTMRWKPALNAFAITFADRMPASEDN
ncbi:hypothetical protein BJF87_22040 [Gordonia sp. CNJ-863]|nr:hypothetical protein BJF87_22040 [Gordonia sp. CNJ-863]QGP86256.1 hypothetical protein GKZ92_00370 [Gordonia sp. 135]